MGGEADLANRRIAAIAINYDAVVYNDRGVARESRKIEDAIADYSTAIESTPATRRLPPTALCLRPQGRKGGPSPIIARRSPEPPQDRKDSSYEAWRSPDFRSMEPAGLAGLYPGLIWSGIKTSARGSP
jgi:hypothetical protein